MYFTRIFITDNLNLIILYMFTKCISKYLVVLYMIQKISLMFFMSFRHSFCYNNNVLCLTKVLTDWPLIVSQCAFN